MLKTHIRLWVALLEIPQIPHREIYIKLLWLLVPCFDANLTTITVVVGIQVLFVPPKLKICQLYHEKLLLQKVNDMYTQVLT